jgi:imidazolonepropionase-like amidohydrolase
MLLPFACIALLRVTAATPADVPAVDVPVAVTNVTIVQPGEATIQAGTILIEHSRISAVGSAPQLPPGTRVIDGSGQYAYPGFIDALSRAGVEEVKIDKEDERRYEGQFESISDYPHIATLRANRKGIRARLRVSDLLNIDEDTFDDLRRSGFAVGLLTPPRAILGGQGAVVSLGREPVRSSVIATDVAHVASLAIPPPRQIKERGGYPGTPLGVVAHLRQTLYDARWYGRMREFAGQTRSVADVPLDPDLAALQRVAAGEQLVLFEANDADQIDRALNVAEEFGLRVAIVGGREAYKVVDRLKRMNVPVAVTLDVPPEARSFKLDEKKVSKPVEDGTLFGKAWEERPFYPQRAYERADQRRRELLANPQRLEQAGVIWCFTTAGLKKEADALKNLQEYIDAGLDPDAALRALTTSSAEIFGVQEEVGALRAGFRGNLTMLNKPLGDRDAKVTLVTIDGQPFELPAAEAKGRKGAKGPEEEPSETKGEIEEQSSRPAVAQSTPEPSEQNAETEAVAIDARRAHTPDWPIETDADRVPAIRTGGSVLLENATVLTISGDDLQHTSILVRDGRIAEIGRDLRAPEGVKRIDLTGYVIMPGIIDPHSHAATHATNEWTLSVTPEVRIADVLNADDPKIYWALSGGVTAMHAMHGSANTIGGQNVFVKLKYGRPVSELVVPMGHRSVKFALGENVKRSGMQQGRRGPDSPRRYPGTRMGVEATMRRALRAGRQYAKERQEYEQALAAGENPKPLRRDLRLEALADILAGDIWVNCHCYRSDEILRLLDVAEDFGFRIAALHHVLEGYRVMPEIARHGCGTATFADWWAYKIEAYEAVPHNAGMMLRYGINSTIKSDSSDLIRHLNHEAAKAMKYAGLTPNEALRLVTLNAARLFGLQDRLGSIEVGKDADLAVFDGHPLDTFSKCVMTLIEGEVYFTHPEFNPSSPSEPRPLKRFGKVGVWGDAVSAPIRAATVGERTGKTPGTVNPRFREPDAQRAEAAVLAAEREQTRRRGNATYAIAHATIHPVSSPPIQDGVIVLRDGKIAAIGGSDMAVPSDAEVIDARGLHVWPGLINAATTLGVYEIGQVGVTVDTSESGTFQPDEMAVSALNPHSAMIPVTRAEGVTTALITPRAPAIAGQAGLVDLDGWTMPEMLIDAKVALVVNLPSKRPEGVVKEREEPQQGSYGRSPRRRDDQTQKRQKEIERFFENARLYAEAVTGAGGAAMSRVAAPRGLEPAAPSLEPDPRYEAMVPYVRGEKPVIFQANGYKEILEALQFAERFDLRPIIAGARDAWKVADLLAEREVPVIYSGLFSLPSRVRGLGNATDVWDGNYRALSILADAGVKFCVAAPNASLAKNLPSDLGFAVAHGLDPDAAVRAMTLNAAEILGIADRVGTLESGKVANVIVTTDHPCQATSVVRHVFIRGREVSLETKHTRNAKKFAARPAPDLPPPPTNLVGPPSQTWHKQPQGVAEASEGGQSGG